MVLSATSATTAPSQNQDSYGYFKKQLLWISIGFAGMLITANYPYRKWKSLDKLAAAASLILLIVVLTVEPVKGSRSWISVGSQQFQPSEMVKFCLILVLAKMMSGAQNLVPSSGRPISKNGSLLPILVVVVVCGLVLLQNDLGSAMVIAASSFVMLFVGGVNPRYLIRLGAAGLTTAGLAIYFAPHRFARILAFIDPYADPRGTGYQIIQSLYAIGSGGLMGVGLGRSMQKYGHIPANHTDFIFSILAEEMGFFGGVFVILLFMFLGFRGYKTAMSSPDRFGSYLACGITTVVLVEAVINIAVVTSSMPVAGITLPFISYGGSSLVFKMTAIGVLLNVSRYTNDDVKIKQSVKGQHRTLEG